jgi:hypothetical protein
MPAIEPDYRGPTRERLAKQPVTHQIMKIYARLKGRTAESDWPELGAELEVLSRYQNATLLAGHTGNLRAHDPAYPAGTAPFWRAGLPLGAVAEDARRWLARAHKAIPTDALKILRAVVIDNLSLDDARKRVGRCSAAGAEILLRNAADRLRDLSDNNHRQKWRLLVVGRSWDNISTVEISEDLNEPETKRRPSIAAWQILLQRGEAP